MYPFIRQYAIDVEGLFRVGAGRRFTDFKFTRRIYQLLLSVVEL